MRGVYFPTLLVLLLLQQPHVYGQSSESASEQHGSQNESTLEGLLKKFAEDLIDQTITKGGSSGHQKGTIRSMSVAERGADYLVADVTYSGAKASGLQLVGYATLKGRRIEGISSLPVPLTDASGTVQIKISLKSTDDLEISSDGIFLAIVQEGDKPDVVADRSFEVSKMWSYLEWLDEPGPKELIFADGSPVIDVLQKTSGTKARRPVSKSVTKANTSILRNTRLKKVYSHKQVSTYKYTATTKNKVKKTGSVRAGNLVWQCRSKSCTISGPWPTPGLSACNRLARLVGKITSYGHPKKKLSASQLAQCNRGAS